jgi:hypothetical protein
MVSLSVGLAVLQSLRTTCKHISTGSTLSSRLRSLAAILFEHWSTRHFPPCWRNLYSIHVRRTSIYPDQTARPCPELRLYQGFGCNSCGFVCKSINQIRQHHNVEHAHVRRHRGGKRVRNRSLRNYASPGMRRVPADHPDRRMLHSWNASHSLNAHIWGGGCISETCRVPASAGWYHGKIRTLLRS